MPIHPSMKALYLPAWAEIPRRIRFQRARDLWHYQNRLIRKVLSHTTCVFMNLQLGRPPIHLEYLVTH